MSDNDALSRLYRQLPAEEPSTRLDAQVLAAVNTELASAREQRERSRRRWRYQVPLATAATLVLAVGIFMQESRTPKGNVSRYGEPMDAEYSVLARESVRGATAYQKAPTTVDELRDIQPPAPAMSPPPPAPVPPPVLLPAPPPPVVAMMDMPAPVAMPEAAPEPPAVRIQAGIAATGAMGLIADRAIRQRTLDTLLKTANGMAAPEFCQRLQALWTATETAPDCPTNDGVHEWPAPLAVTWQVEGGRVVRAERQR